MKHDVFSHRSGEERAAASSWGSGASPSSIEEYARRSMNLTSRVIFFIAAFHHGGNLAANAARQALANS
ncbi:hypothetical protein WME79_04645 [Sorangium sp. So ce726]|uniref:hypothetical protein n=1 Tax=Sorangium sp. So ce726 TaxID=3133319 RepID=UPI003F5ED3F8